jgi:hypothetical protein
VEVDGYVHEDPSSGLTHSEALVKPPLDRATELSPVLHALGTDDEIKNAIVKGKVREILDPCGGRLPAVIAINALVVSPDGDAVFAHPRPAAATDLEDRPALLDEAQIPIDDGNRTG